MKKLSMFNFQFSMKSKTIGTKVYAAVLLVLLVAFFNPFTAVMVALFFIAASLLELALKEIKVKSLFYEEDKEY